VTRRHAFVWFTVLAFGYAFLYLPILTLMVYSFNDSRLVTVWGGFSTRWYGELLRNDAILSAFWLSIRIGLLNASVAVVLGTLAALTLVRFRRFRSRILFSGLILAPLIMPEVVLGLSMLLLFVTLEQWIGWPPGRGMTTITLAHITFTTAYVTILVQSRLLYLDVHLEEAALDLGARPWKVFLVIILPTIAPSLLAGWLLGFTLSMDDLVIASFVAGPGATTLPMIIHSSVRLGVSPQINALATLMVLIVTTGVVCAGWLIHRQVARAGNPP
jgi:putrescine transport system permease protein